MSVIRDRMDMVERIATAHQLAADGLSKWHMRLGLPVVILTAIVGTTVFASLTETGEQYILVAIITSILSVVASVLAAVQTFMAFGDRAKSHALASSELFHLWRQLQKLLFVSHKDAEREQRFDEVDTEISKCIKSAPALSTAQENAARTVLKDRREQARAEKRARMSLNESRNDDE